jgi:hypothetical protein
MAPSSSIFVFFSILRRTPPDAKNRGADDDQIAADERQPPSFAIRQLVCNAEKTDPDKKEISNRPAQKFFQARKVEQNASVKKNGYKNETE